MAQKTNKQMAKLNGHLSSYIKELSSSNKTAQLNLRAHQVRERYKHALEKVYGKNAHHFLMHTNNVYIMNKNNVRTLIVYVDDSIFAAELNAQRELITLKLLELFKEDIETFEIHISRGRYKTYHPYLQQTNETDEPKQNSNLPHVSLDNNERQLVDKTVSCVEDEGLRGRIAQAMTASLEWKKGEKGDSQAKNRKQ